MREPPSEVENAFTELEKTISALKDMLRDSKQYPRDINNKVQELREDVTWLAGTILDWFESWRTT